MKHSRNRTQFQKSGAFTASGFRYHRRWAVDCDYLKALPASEREWMHRFLAEYYDADNKLLRPEQHLGKCRTCREGGDCGRRPPPQALHASDELRRDCYNRQWWSHADAWAGRVSLWEDFDGVDTGGNVVQRGSTGSMGFESMRPRLETGDHHADNGSVDSPSAVGIFRRLARRGR